MAMFQGFMVNNYNKRRFHTLHHIFKDWPAMSSSLLKSTFFSKLRGREMYDDDARGCCVFVAHNVLITLKKKLFFMVLIENYLHHKRQKKTTIFGKKLGGEEFRNQAGVKE